MSLNDTDMQNLDYFGWISGDTTTHVILNFYSGAPDGSLIRETFVYLLNPELYEANFACKPYFPAIKEIKLESFPENPERHRHKIEVHFEAGSLSYFYEEATCQRRIKKVDGLHGGHDVRPSKT